MQVVFHDFDSRLSPDFEEIVPIFWNYDPDLLIGEASVRFEHKKIVADVALFDDLAPEWFIGMMHDCPDMWGTAIYDNDIFMIGVVPPTETNLSMLVIEKLGEVRRKANGV